MAQKSFYVLFGHGSRKKRLTRKTTQRKNQKNGFRKRSRQRKGGLRSDWTETNRVQDEHGIYIVYHSALHPRIHITYRGEDNFHATPNLNKHSHFGHDTLYNDGKVGFWGNATTEEKNKLKNAWLSFNLGYITPPVVRQDILTGAVVMSRTPTPRGSTNPEDYDPFKP
jgi:hypothetical protein